MPSRVEIHSRRRVFDGFFKIEEAELEYELFDGTMTPSLKRLVFERGDSVAALVYHREENRFLRQFRFPTYEKGQGWLTEVVAGMQEHGEPAEDALKREILEEIGYEVPISNRSQHSTFPLADRRSGRADVADERS